MSTTVIVKLHEAVLPAASVAVQFTVVTPTGKKSTEVAEQLQLTPGQLSAAETEKETLAPHLPGSLKTEMLLGQLMVGLSLSFTVTVDVQLPVLPAASQTVSITVLPPRSSQSKSVIERLREVMS